MDLHKHADGLAERRAAGAAAKLPDVQHGLVAQLADAGAKPIPDVAALAGLLRGRRVVALTGAGCSTESGIPDYRGPGTARRARNPILGRAFARETEVRRRYWARSMVGWQRVASARPNPAHWALAELERRGVLAGVITQNVDGLHHAAGSRSVIELHGSLHRVGCLDCGGVELREAFQGRLRELNPSTVPPVAAMAPDGDADLEEVDVSSFRVAGCRACGGVLKPSVVFFGEAVPRERVDAAYQLVEQAEAMLVVGSSLTVFSGLRFVRRAAERGHAVAIVNLGSTRGDSLAQLRLDAKAGEVLPQLLDGLT